MVTLTIDRQIELYSKSLLEALLKVSDYRLDEAVAEKIAYQYAKQLDYSDAMLMHVGVTTVASNLVSKIKSEYFNA
ncbi:MULTISPECIES: hypothetical protein [Streptococcus]|uniref:Uncharacterized protein n=1 Tax=Streptococcus pseudoporcinus TaxID=361101 RepID=A0A4U9XW17_9STRE|nr:hypothetical protein [Streptococcus pseudoporcinus]VTS17095.1 Uncharacterised protein [Streptococcus pseudoporcinus]VUC68181.1 Uncharacterised protein [Streptococcus pseudoporcinus]VUC99049.1 Uncharacterised protein [Streptococcus pseudoporcinus]VUC99441.1 Uncharacterised protein [Streptococcus pseudoporcinus]